MILAVLVEFNGFLQHSVNLLRGEVLDFADFQFYARTHTVAGFEFSYLVRKSQARFAPRL